MSLAGDLCYSALRTLDKQTIQNSKAKNIMSQEKKTIKVRDLKPNKDAKGGFGRVTATTRPSGSAQGSNPSGKVVSTGSRIH
jgi:hypothetical protein